jgi:hypothetical protein
MDVFSMVALAAVNLGAIPPDIQIPSHPVPAVIGTAQVNTCASNLSISAQALSGGIVWTLDAQNNDAWECFLPALDFPGIVGDAGLGVAVPLEPDFRATRLDASNGSCALQTLEGGTAIHCENNVLAAGTKMAIRVWTAGIQPPPHRYCLQGVVTAAAAGTASDCIDVYAFAEHRGFVLEGPIDKGNNVLEWIGGNYPVLPPTVSAAAAGADDTSPLLADGSYVQGAPITKDITMPQGKVAHLGFGAFGGESAWSCVAKDDRAHLACTLPSVPAGLLPALLVMID